MKTKICLIFIGLIIFLSGCVHPIALEQKSTRVKKDLCYQVNADGWYITDRDANQLLEIMDDLYNRWYECEMLRSGQMK